MAPIPAGQPDVRLPGDGAGAQPPRRRRELKRAALQLFLVWLAAAIAIRLARFSGVAGPAAVGGQLKIAAASVGFFGLSGFALTRLALPAALRRHELLWVVPVGACAAAIALTVLGFAAVPFKVSLAIVIAAGGVTSVVAWRRAGPPPLPARSEIATLAWPAYIAVLVACVALIPVFRSGFATVIGTGSDAHLAAGTAQFLQRHYPTSVAPDGPVDRMPLVWRSKQPIYYAFGAIATLSGLETYQTLAGLAAVLLALAVCGFYVLTRDVLKAGLFGALLAAALAGLDRMVLHTIMHPYFNQTWGFMTMAFSIVLAWQAVTARSRGGLLLLVLFLAVGAFAYPLYLPIPLLAFVVMLWLDRRARRARGDEVVSLSPRRLYRGRHSLLWMVPAALVFAIPVLGVLEKMITAVGVVAPGQPLGNWGGDLSAFYPEHQFLATGSTVALLIVAPFALVAIGGELRRADRRLAWALGAVLAFGAVAAAYFRPRADGFYFHFKVLAFIGPIAVALAVVGVSRWREAGRPPWMRWAATAGMCALFITAFHDSTTEIRTTFPQLQPSTIALRGVAQQLPPGASIRLDLDVNEQLWAAYFLAARPLCSQRPLLGTSYPHVPISRKADFILVDHGLRTPFDAQLPALATGAQYDLYRMKPSVPGPNRCSQTMVQTVTKIA